MTAIRSSSHVIVFTDLDGTLLDEAYSFKLSREPLKRLQDNGVSVVFCSSKTRREQEVIRASLHVRDPFIVENGGAIIVPPGTVDVSVNATKEEDGTQVVVLGKRAGQIIRLLDKICIETGLILEGFHTLTDEQVALLTGLSIEAAKRARCREVSATITRLEPDELKKVFLEACDARDLNCEQGGRFLGITSKGADKGNAVRLLTACYQARYGEVLTVGIGDSPNDALMLRAVRYPFLVQRPNGEWAPLDVPNTTYLPAIGPLGFAAMVEDLAKRGLVC